jgi:hypothetical protein
VRRRSGDVAGGGNAERTDGSGHEVFVIVIGTPIRINWVVCTSGM